MKRFFTRLFVLSGMVLVSAGVELIAQDGGGIFEVGPVMNRTRIVPLCASLSNGNVGVFGGREVGFVSGFYADFYDPSLNTFGGVSMNNSHDGACIIKLNDGKYFIAGGSENLGVAPGYNITEVYDVIGNNFSLSVPMSYPRMQHNGTQLVDGRILIAGAWYNNEGASTAEVIDLNAETSTLTGAMITPRSAPMVLPTNDGNAYVFGGYPSYSGPLINSVEEFDHTNNTFSSVSADLIPSVPGWSCYASMNNRPASDYMMTDGRYAFLVYRSDPQLEYRIMIFDPETKSFELFETSSPLLDAVIDGGIYDAVMDRDNNRMYMLGLKLNTSPIEVGLIGVDLDNGNTQHAATTYVMPADEFFYPTMTYIPSYGKILVVGVSSTNGDYFHATDKTYLITPDEILGVDFSEKEYFAQLYPNPADNSAWLSLNALENGKARIDVVDITGRVVLSEIKFISSGRQQILINTSSLSTGQYVLRIVPEGLAAANSNMPAEEIHFNVVH